jgi:hypothetical protein
VGQRNDPVDPLDAVGLVLGDPGDLTGDRRRAVDGGEYADVVAGGDPTVRPAEALEATAQIGRQPRSGRRRHSVEGSRGGVLRHPEVVHVYVLARADVGQRTPDHLAVLAHQLSSRQVAQGDLVSGRYVGA